MGGFLTTCACISTLHYIACRKEGPTEGGRIPYDLRVHQHASLYHGSKVVTQKDSIEHLYAILFSKRNW